MDAYGPLFRKVLFPAWESGLRRRPTLSRLAELERTQWLSLDELRAYQLRELLRLLRHAYAHVPFYRARFQAAGLTPEDIRSADDLSRLPILSRDEARDHARERESTAPPLPTLRKQTSGTTGHPLLFGYDPDSEYWRQAVKWRAYGWAGYRPGDRALFFWGGSLPHPPPRRVRAKIALDRLLRREHHVPCARMSDEVLRGVVDYIIEHRPSVLVCYAQAGVELARFIRKHDLRRWGTLPVLCGAERLLPADRVDLEAAFGKAVFDTYGSREVMLIGAECEAHDGLHLSMENLLVEVVVTEPDGTRRPARPGETGEVVITDLHNLGMPFIRYANGDVAVAGGDERCSCGRAAPRIRSVEGRVSETLRDGRGAAVSGITLSYLFHDIAGSVRQFQAVQHKDRSVTMNIVLSEPLPESVLDSVRRHGERLVEGVQFRVRTVPELPRNPAGKHHLVVVER